MSWLYRLAGHTVAHHASADAQRLALMNVTSAGQYRALLERIFGFETAVELAASSLGGTVAAGARPRNARLHQDLRSLGMSEQEIATLPAATVDVRTASQALGWLFVVERHVLVAGLIRRHLASELLGTFATARAYLDTHVDGGARFREVADIVGDALARGDVRPGSMLLAARAAFDAQRQWYARPSRRSRPVSSQVTRPRNAA
jgi:heme oxygenase